MKPALFLDRDGVLNEVVMRGPVVSSPRSLAECQLIQDAKLITTTGRNKGFFSVVVTNQPDVERLLLAPSVHEEINTLIKDYFDIDLIEVCESADHTNYRRKPNPGMILDAAKKLDIDLCKSFIVGDSAKDIEAGRLAGLRTILLARDYNKKSWGMATYTCHSYRDISTIIDENT